MNKGLEVLNKMLNARTADDRDYYLFTYADQLEKELLALDIIRRHMMVVSLVYTCKTAHEYSQKVSGYSIPTDREYNIVREVICNE